MLVVPTHVADKAVSVDIDARRFLWRLSHGLMLSACLCSAGDDIFGMVSCEHRLIFVDCERHDRVHLAFLSVLLLQGR